MNEEVDKICEAVYAALAACGIFVVIRVSNDYEGDDKSSCMVIDTGDVTEPILVGSEKHSISLSKLTQEEWEQQPAKTYYCVGHIHQRHGGDIQPDSWDYKEDYSSMNPVMVASWIISHVFVEHTNPILARFYPGAFGK